ncbi:MAG: hypothetical protein IRZ26_04625 [Clostridia bacterium]|nr:hypothetical protein [Clostridia bacterium]
MGRESERRAPRRKGGDAGRPPVPARGAGADGRESRALPDLAGDLPGRQLADPDVRAVTDRYRIRPQRRGGR